MTISSNYNFSSTRDDIIKGALRILGVLSQGQTPNTTQVTDSAEALNMLVKAWASEGIPIWLIKKQDITLIANTSTYPIGLGETTNVAKPIKIYQVLLHDNTTNVDIPMVALSQQEYQSLSQKDAISSTPIQYYYENLRTTGNLYVFPKPDTSGATSKKLQIIYQSPLADFDASTDEPDLPQEGIRALKWALAAELSYEYGYPPKERIELINRAEQIKRDFFSSVEEESSLYFKIDYRGN